MARAGGWLRPNPPFGVVALAWAGLALLVASATTSAALGGFKGAQADFLVRQDLPGFAVCVAIVAAAGWTPTTWARRLGERRAPRNAAIVLALAGLCVLIGAAGEPILFHGYRLSLDEHLADFDAKIFGRGLIAAPIDPRWRPFAPALQPAYMLPIPSHAHWVSAYLPGNALLRALASKVGLQRLVNPLLSGVSVVAVYGVALRLWPGRHDLALGAAALLATSAQLLVTAMTAYAMPAHLAFNLAWLWLFLRGGRLGHVGAIAAGFVASGLHQLLFHPLFVAPFVAQLWLDRRWSLAAAYTLAYAAIGLFWIEVPRLELAGLGETAPAGGAGVGYFAARAGAFLAAAGPGNLSATIVSLVRFVTWQNVLTAPLAVIGAPLAWRAGGTLRALGLGVVLTIIVVMVLVPTQTHGWGYRYLHGLLGSVCLLATAAWRRLAGALAEPDRRLAWGAFWVACGASLLVLVPLRAWQAADFVRPYARAAALVGRAPEPVVVVDDEAPWFDSGTVVRNDPFLERGPKVMLLAALSEAQVRALCAAGPLGLFDGRMAAALGLQTVETPLDTSLSSRRALITQLRCARPLA